MSGIPAQLPLRIAVFGAGSIGCRLGGALAAGADVTLIGRAAPMAELDRAGLTLTGPGDRRLHARPRTAVDASAAAGADYVLVTVKSADTAEAARLLATHLDGRTTVVSFQNGLHNARTLREALPGRTVLAGMVPYNVVRTGPASFHQGTSGELLLERAPAAGRLARAAAAAGLPVGLRADMPRVQAAKLLMNLNNAVNALSGLPLREQLGSRPYRLVLARCQREALAVFAAAGLVPARLTPVPPAWMPSVLGLPDPVFRRVAAASLRVDARARSSMWEDLQRARPTEVDELQGEVVALADRHRLPAPANRRLRELVHQAERAAVPPAWSGPDLLAALD
ncbi:MULTISPECIES: 2-dehydropantoate 2-reductase [Kitasatospora]|uniref:2-dehydropantoate 2-reductase n=1 Tax=Kitasatospora setae (strain ATCC 33774 / DSM 43861 / JCM 3304 / KCC A-0304 / NBRC 14216 / KM-6054) TaxID=452652 RepID=E4N4I8_KITSK|nr:2-dehydropantoate 2-reductase [Kitasatospora setae]BAJ26119.1 putative ketopantoate reductase [Kitasatospora setae KM-6054]